MPRQMALPHPLDADGRGGGYGGAPLHLFKCVHALTDFLQAAAWQWEEEERGWTRHVAGAREH